MADLLVLGAGMAGCAAAVRAAQAGASVVVAERARVLDEHGTAVPGLLAAGADTGGVFVRPYAGGIANALIVGLRAAATALS